MDNKIDNQVAEFLKDILVTQNASVKKFEDNITHLKFDEENSSVWQFIVLKSFDVDFQYLLPLANHLVDNNYCLVTKHMLQYAVLNGYQIEVALNSMKDVENQLNNNMKDFHFEEKLVIVNEPAQNIYNLAKKLVNRSNDNDFQEVSEMFAKSGIDSTKAKLLQRPQTGQKLKI